MRALLIYTFFLALTIPLNAQSWQKLALPTTQDIASSSFINDSEGWIGFENASPVTTLYHTADGGNTWSAVAISGSPTGTSYVCFISALKGFVVMNGEAFKTTNGGTSWTQMSLPGTPYYKPYFFNENTGFIAGAGVMFKTIDGGDNWTAYPVEYSSAVLWDIHFDNELTGYATEYNGYLWTTYDGGESWWLENDGGLWNYFYAVYFKPDGSINYTGYEDIFGEFTSYIAGTSYSSQDIGNLYDLKWFNTNRGFAVGQYGWVVYTDNGGAVWNELVVADLFGVNDYHLNQVDGFSDVFVFGDHGTAFKLPLYCIAAPAFNYFVSEGDVEFTDVSVNAAAWLWDFGDGTTSDLQNPSHTYEIAGTYKVCLTTSMNGCLTDSVCQFIVTCEPNESIAAAGTIDETFGENGFAIINTGAFTDDFHSLVVQPEGSILAGGEKALCRFLANGSPDSTFDNDGKLQEWYWAYDHFAITTDGKIVVGSRDSDDFWMVRYLTSGTVDSSFGINGKVTTDHSKTDEDDFVTALLIQPDQKILILGYYGSSVEKTVVVRYSADGQLDSSFAGDGILKLNIPNFYPAALNIQANGKILIGGESEGVDFIVKRLNENGTSDGTFGDNGLASVDFPSAYSSVFKLLLQDDGKILVAGNTESNFTIVRFETQGMLDLNFGDNGVSTIQAFDSDDVPRSAILQPDGKMLMAGYSQNYPGYNAMILLRFTSEGIVDSSFGNDGRISTLVNCDDSRAQCLAVDGNYIYAGGGRHSTYGESCIVRYLNGCEVPIALEVVNIAPTLVALNWEDASGADSYKLRYKVSGSGAWQKLTAQVSEKKMGGLLPETKYSVQVRSNCNNGESTSDWSEKFQFTTPPQKLSDEIASSVALLVYPNPFSDQAVVQFAITQNSWLEIALFDLQGKKIRILAEGNFERGMHHLLFQNQNLPAGVYFLQLKASTESSLQKIIIE